MKLLNSNMIIYFGNERRKVPLLFSVLSLESLPQTDSPNLLILFLVKDTQTRIKIFTYTANVFPIKSVGKPRVTRGTP